MQIATFRQYLPGVLVLLLFFGSCTTEKDGLSYRIYHNTTARYNGFFYAKESIKEAKTKLLADHEEDYDEILPPFIYGTEEKARAVYPQLERTIEKSSKVVERHTMDVSERERRKMKHPEMNRWIDDNYFLIGQGYFYKRNYYKAEEIFRYCSRKYKNPDMEAKAGTWLARTFMELGDLSGANNELLKVSVIKDLDDEVLADYHMVQADYFIRREDYQKAALEMESAIAHIKKKKHKARPTFILAQLYQEIEDAQRAIDMYDAVLKLKPEYELEFYAQINQAQAFSRRGGNSTMIKEKLEKMLKDDKNIDYRDQIYYALAGVYLEERNNEEGIANLHESLKENKGNQKQKGKSYLKLADVYFEEREYPDAQAYYDSSLSIIKDNHPRYKDIKNRAESLTDLVKNLDIIQREDSLQALSMLSPEELDARLDKIIKDLEEEERRKEEAAAAALAAGAQVAGGGSNWAFYNPALLAEGYNTFKNIWGDRPLEDNWRRSRKLNEGVQQEEEEEGSQEEVVAEAKESKIPGKEELRDDIPNSPEEIEKSNAALAEAYYNCGLIYKEKLDDFENAVESFEILADRFESSKFHVLACYQLYRAYLAKEQEGYQNPFCGTCNSKYWGDLLVSMYPDSEYALLVLNPEYKSIEALRQAEEVEAYNIVLTQYRERQYSEAVAACNRVISKEKDNHLLPKYYLLRAMSTGGMDRLTGERDNYIAQLREVISLYPEAEEGIRAKEILDILLGEMQKESGPEEEEEKPEEEPEEDDLYVLEEGTEHYFAVVFNRDRGSFNEVKAKISDFSAQSYNSLGLKVSSNLLDKDRHIVLAKPFKDMAEGMEFYNTFISDTGILKDLNAGGYERFLISKKNYVALFKDKNLDKYLNFFNANYLK